ncbi:hypothetical protein R3P38DRAFT_3200988 [Favolaschia claudopus]|uniref:Uncharacterized protein n=1 Tax=Favolaschia claudopus TaxID=2862362 RepID=A0AAW0AZA5_9AGAR
MPFKRQANSSDYDSDFVPPPPRRPRRVSKPPSPSFPPSSPPPQSTPDQNLEGHIGPTSAVSDDEHESMAPLPALFPHLLHPEATSSTGEKIFPPETLWSPGPPSPCQLRPSSPMTILDSSPVKRGRPHNTPKTARLKKTVRRLRLSRRTSDQKICAEAMKKLETKTFTAAAHRLRSKQARLDAKKRERKLAADRRAKEAAEQQVARDAAKTIRAQQILDLITAPEDEGGFNFESLSEFFDAVWRPGGDGIISSKITKYIQSHGAQHAAAMFKRSKEARTEYLSDAFAEIFQREGRAIQAILTRDSTTTVTDLLKDFSMDQLAEELEAAAPTFDETSSGRGKPTK